MLSSVCDPRAPTTLQFGGRKARGERPTFKNADTHGVSAPAAFYGDPAVVAFTRRTRMTAQKMPKARKTDPNKKSKTQLYEL